MIKEIKNSDDFSAIKPGEYFVYFTVEPYPSWRKGIKLGNGMMVPVGLRCETRELAEMQS